MLSLDVLGMRLNGKRIVDSSAYDIQVENVSMSSLVLSLKVSRQIGYSRVSYLKEIQQADFCVYHHGRRELVEVSRRTQVLSCRRTQL